MLACKVTRQGVINHLFNVVPMSSDVIDIEDRFDRKMASLAEEEAALLRDLACSMQEPIDAALAGDSLDEVDLKTIEAFLDLVDCADV